MPSHPSRLLVASLALIGGSPINAMADGPPGYGPRVVQMESEYARESLDAYGRGYAWVESADGLELEAESATDERSRSEARARAAQKYGDALRAFTEAIQSEPRFYEAHTYVGYVYRKLGRYDRSLEAYEQALLIKPDYALAIEYQGEAFLGLDRFENARFNYLRLYALDGIQARKLLDAMTAWGIARKRDAKGLPDDRLEAAIEWIEARAAEPAASNSDGW